MKINGFFFFLLFFFAIITICFFSTSIAKGQYNCTWALNATTLKTPNLTGIQAPNVVAGDMLPGINFPNPGTHNTDGYACTVTVNWPTAPTDGFNIDFPISPVGNNILVISSFNFKVKTANSSGFNTIGLAYQTDGAGPWTFFGNTVDVNTSSASLDTAINFSPLSLSCNHTYIIRMYIYAPATGTPPNSGRKVTIGNVVMNGLTSICITSPPTVITTLPSSITCFNANSGGNVTLDGGSAVTSRGICWSTSPNPTISNNITTDGSGLGIYPSLMTGLLPSTTYYVRAYAINSVGIGYGIEYSFTTPPPTPTLLTNISSLQFGTDSTNSCSTPLSFNISGFYLNTTDSIITITAPPGFRVSTNIGGAYYPYIQLPYTGNSLPATTIYITFCPTQAIVYDDSVTCNSLGALTNYIHVTGTGVAAIDSLQNTQGLSNRGKEFWTGYGSTEYMYSTNEQELQFTFSNSNNVAANVNISIPLLGYAFSVTVPANGAFTTAPGLIPKTGGNDARLPTEGVFNRGILITSDTPIVAYCHNVSQKLYAATVLFPVPTLGKEYRSLNYLQRTNFDSAKSYLFIVGTEDNTTIEVTLPVGVATDTHPAGSIFTQVLNRGQVLNLMGKSTSTSSSAPFTAMDLSGTLVKSIAVNGVCKPFAMFCGSTKITIDCSNGGGGSGDNLFQQMMPRQAWGNKYIAIPTVPLNNNFYRILVADPATVVTRNGVPLTGLVNNYYEYYNNTGIVDVIEGNNPILVAQYMTTKSQCSNGSTGDPEMIYLSSLQQSIDTITFVSSPLGVTSSRSHFLNVAIPAAGVSTFKLDGVLRAASFLPVPFDPTIYYAQFTGLTETFHTITAAIGCNATAYGVAQDESYGYNAGTNLKTQLPNYLLQNQYGTGPSPVACRNNEFYLNATLNFIPTQLEWHFFNNPNLTPNQNFIQTNPVPFDSFYVNSQIYYVFRNPNTFIYSQIGQFTFEVVATMPIPDGCDNKKTYLYTVNVIEKPRAEFSFTTADCSQSSISFFDHSVANGLILDQWSWSFGDPSSGSNNTILQNPVHSFSNSGSYAVNLHILTLEGCYDDTTVVVQLNVIPNIFNLNSPTICYSTNAQTAFLNYDSTSGAPVHYSITWNSSPANSLQNIISDTLIASPISLSVPANTDPGTYTGLIVVTNASGCNSDSIPFSINVSDLPQLTVSGQNPSCQNECDGSIQINVTGGNAPYHYVLASNNPLLNISWTGSGDTTINNLCEGNYAVSVSDSNGCTTNRTSYEITNKNIPCIKIISILADAFSEKESDEEIIFLKTGNKKINPNDIKVKWPTGEKWQGCCNNFEYIKNANRKITAGGKLIPVEINQFIPENSNLIIVSSNKLKNNTIDLSKISEKVYILFQCSYEVNVTNYLNDNVNENKEVELEISVGKDCVERVKYNPSMLKKNNR